MQVLFVLRFYHLYIKRIILDSGSKTVVWVNRLVKKLMYDMYVIQFELPLATFTLFVSVVKKHFGSCIQSIRFISFRFAFFQHKELLKTYP